MYTHWSDSKIHNLKPKTNMGRAEPCVLFSQTFIHTHLDEYVDEVTLFFFLAFLTYIYFMNWGSKEELKGQFFVVIQVFIEMIGWLFIYWFNEVLQFLFFLNLIYGVCFYFNLV